MIECNRIDDIDKIIQIRTWYSSDRKMNESNEFNGLG